jgi:hypothetical protein
LHSDLRNPETDEKKSIEMKLAEAFFHQHREVKEICEFAVDRVLKHELNDIAIECTKQTFQDENISSESTDEMLTNAEVVSFTRAQEMLKDRLEDVVRRSLVVFGFESSHPRVLEVATTLSSTRGMHSAKSMLRNLVSNAVDSTQRQKHKGDETSKAPLTSGASNTNLAVLAIENLVTRLETSRIDSSEMDVLTLMSKANESIQNLGTEYDSALPGEANLRKLITSLRQLDRKSDTLVAWCESLVGKDYYRGVSTLLGLMLAVRSVSSYGLHQLKQKTFKSAIILRFLEASIDAMQGTGQVTQFLNRLLEENILDVGIFIEVAKSPEASEFAREVVLQIIQQIKT